MAQKIGALIPTIHGADKHTDRTRYIWISAGECVQTPYATRTIKDCVSMQVNFQPGLGLENSVADNLVTAHLYRPLDYVSTPKFKAVFVCGSEFTGNTVRLDYGSKAIAVGEVCPDVLGLATTIGIDVSESLVLNILNSSRTDGTTQNLDAWNADDLMFMFVGRDYDHIDDTYSDTLIFLGFLVSYTADQ